MTTTVNETDFEVIEFLDFDFAPPCESEQGCDQTATWRVQLSCCGKVYLFCEEDYHLAQAFIRSIIGPLHQRPKNHPTWSEGCGYVIERLIVEKL